MQQLKIWIVIKQSTNLELNEPVLEWVTEVGNLQGVPPTGGEGETMVTP